MIQKNKDRHTFNYFNYTITFDFCDIREKNLLYRCLENAWEWAHPPVKSAGSADDSKENTNK